jgi:hypothetical protein
MPKVLWEGNYSGSAAASESFAAEAHFLEFEKIRRDTFLTTENARFLVFINAIGVKVGPILFHQDIGILICIDGDTKVVKQFEKFPSSFMGYFRDLAHVCKNIGSAFHNRLYYVRSCID